jgi:predicted methyltransferase
MRNATLLITAALLLGSAGAVLAANPPAHIAAAVAHQARPQADLSRDSTRKPADMLAFAGVKPGDTVIDIVPGSGYFTRVFAVAVGAKGKVVAYVPTEIAGKYNSEANARKLPEAYPNVEVAVQPLGSTPAKGIADVVFTAQNYHDFHTPLFGGVDVAKVNQAVFDVLKPGGVYIVIDHAAEEGSGLRDANTLHRIDPETVKAELQAAGFTYEGESNLLRNKDDKHTANVFDPAIRGRTDQFVYKFRKPK